MKPSRSGRPRALICAAILLTLLTCLLALVSRPVAAQQGNDVYAAADLLSPGVGEGPPQHGVPSGTATFAHLAGGSTRVTVVVLSLPTNSTHAIHIHDGSCTGPILHPLQNLVADANGMAKAMIDIDVQVDFERWYVDVHESATYPSPYVICGKVTPALAGALPPGQPPASMPSASAPPSLPPARTPTALVLVPGMPATGEDRQAGNLALVFTGIVAVALAVAAGIYVRRAI